MSIADEFRTRNFSIYGQWLGILAMILCLALGIANIFTFDPIIIIFCALAIASAFVILFVEVPLLLRICPTSEKFDSFIRKISTNYLRAATYAIMAVVQFLSTIRFNTSLIAAGVFLSLAGLCYLFAAVRGQDFVNSKTLGGQGIAQMVV
ncbi:hypothetical protein ACRALDRAFT_1064062 [Sodiomyces alcalophilus JCM 7366]|uniref:uncharacterized protein n=1 Tax=Sodiomyces alcalophilus JCM 7366 TaxID=591952 RepID=UPI0039B4A114